MTTNPVPARVRCWRANGAGSWDTNPWVWAVSFAVLGAGTASTGKESDHAYG